MRWSAALPMWRVQAARVLAWALLLAGWAGLGSFAQTLAPGTFSAFALLALWLLATGVFEACMGPLRRRPWMRLGLLLGAAVLAGWALDAVRRGGGMPALAVASLSWAWLCAAAMAAARDCRGAGDGPPRRLAQSAAAGAFLAWGACGDIGDLNTLGVHLTWAGMAAGLLLGMLLPWRSAATLGGTALLPGCALPVWSMRDGIAPQRSALFIASLAMPAMMSSLPLMVGLCRGDAVSPQSVLGFHFAVMFVPALLTVGRPADAAVAPIACAALLALGALALLFAPGTAVWWGIAFAHGAAWSVGWAAQLQAGTAKPRPSSVAGMATYAVLVAVLGGAVAAIGPQAIEGWHVALGLAGFLTLAAAPVRRLRPDRWSTAGIPFFKGHSGDPPTFDAAAGDPLALKNAVRLPHETEVATAKILREGSP